MKTSILGIVMGVFSAANALGATDTTCRNRAAASVRALAKKNGSDVEITSIEVLREQRYRPLGSTVYEVLSYEQGDGIHEVSLENGTCRVVKVKYTYEE